MCEPVAIAGLGLALASTAYTTYETDQNVKAQNRFNQKAADEGSKLAQESFASQSAAMRLRQSQEAAAAHQAIFENDKKAAEARATAKVSAAEAGVSGVSVNNLIGDFYRQQGNYNASVGSNLDMTNDQLDSQIAGLRSGAVDRTFSLQQPAINRPSYLAAGLAFSNQALGVYDRYRYHGYTGTGATGGYRDPVNTGSQMGHL